MNLKNSFKFSLSWKLFVVGFMIAILMIPTGLIAILVNERSNRQEAAFQEVSEKWGYEQIITGPVLSVPYKVVSESIVNGQKKIEETVHYAYFLPDTLHIAGTVSPETRQRGIYEVAVYNTALTITGEFSAPDFSPWEIAPEMVQNDKAAISLGIPDMRGIKENINLLWDKKPYSLAPGLPANEVLGSGASAKVAVEKNNKTKKYEYSLNLALNGSRNLSFSPLGKTTSVQLSSAWPSPSFQGAFLPVNYTLGDDGFKAEWKVLELNRNFPQSWLGSLNNYAGSGPVAPVYDEGVKPASITGGFYSGNFGVTLLVPADEYQQTTRTLKYAVLALALTFLVLFFYEAIKRQPVHPLQYILIGLALALFYVLVLAISEHLGFDWAYAIATAATVGLIALYSKSVFGAWKPAGVESLILLFIYGFIYVILQLEDYSLLVGAIGLFVILATVMYVSRRIDWYALGEKQ
ncbi:MAG: cell envelope integrity protein CreD [Planctomycetes bacterium]|nr:cell envelope integrity protein CreD [Planctomycetota bacterium]